MQVCIMTCEASYRWSAHCQLGEVGARPRPFGLEVADRFSSSAMPIPRSWGPKRPEIDKAYLGGFRNMKSGRIFQLPFDTILPCPTVYVACLGSDTRGMCVSQVLYTTTPCSRLTDSSVLRKMPVLQTRQQPRLAIRDCRICKSSYMYSKV